jgi:hypothetical protein
MQKLDVANFTRQVFVLPILVEHRVLASEVDEYSSTHRTLYRPYVEGYVPCSEDFQEF